MNFDHNTQEQTFRTNLIHLNDNQMFIKLSTEIAEVAQTQNIQIIPFTNHNLIYFSKLSVENRKNILNHLRIYLSICKNIVAECGTNYDFSQSIWIALKELGFTPSSDLFSYLTANKIIEIHNLQGQQIYRNLYFFKFCSYTLEELYSIPWVELFHRPQKNIDQMISFVQKVSVANIHNTIRITEIDPHELIETKSKFKIKSYYEPLYYSPLFDKAGNIVASLAIEDAHVISMDNKVEDPSPISENVIPLFPRD